MRILETLLKRLFCAHEWEASPFQALNAPNQVSYKCSKCGKWKHVTQGKDR